MARLDTPTTGFGGFVKNLRKIFGNKSKCVEPSPAISDGNWVVEGGVNDDSLQNGNETFTVLDSWESNEAYQKAIDDLCSGNSSCAVRKRGSIKEKCARRWQSLTNLFEGKKKNKETFHQDEEFGEEDMQCSLEGLADMNDSPGGIEDNPDVFIGTVDTKKSSETSSEESIKFYVRPSKVEADSSSEEDEDSSAVEEEEEENLHRVDSQDDEYTEESDSCSSLSDDEESLSGHEDDISGANCSPQESSSEVYEKKNEEKSDFAETGDDSLFTESVVDSDTMQEKFAEERRDGAVEIKDTEVEISEIEEANDCKKSDKNDEILQEIAQAKRVNAVRLMWEKKQNEPDRPPKFDYSTFPRRKKWIAQAVVEGLKLETEENLKPEEDVVELPAPKRFGIFAKIQQFEDQIEEEEEIKQKETIDETSYFVDANSHQDNSTMMFAKRARTIAPKVSNEFNKPIRQSSLEDDHEEPPKRSVLAMASFLQTKKEREGDDFSRSEFPRTPSLKPVKKHKYEEEIAMEDDFIAKLMNSSLIGEEKIKDVNENEEKTIEKQSGKQGEAGGKPEITDDFFQRTMDSSAIPKEIKKRLVDEFWALFNDSKISASIKQPILNKLIADYEVT